MKSNADAIVKALKCCNVPSGRACNECPYHEVGAECRTKRNKDAVELILELTEGNEKLRDTIDEVADINSVWVNDCIRMHKQMKVLKEETIQNMRKKLSDRSEFLLRAENDGGLCYVDFCVWFDEVVKEILGEE